MKKNVKIAGIIGAMALLGGGISLQSCNNSTTTVAAVKKPAKLKFEYVKPPMAINSQTEANKYLVAHFWDKFNFTDTLFISEKDEIDQAMSNYVYRLSLGDIANSKKSIVALIEDSHQDKNMHHAILDKLMSYVGDPNSPARNEPLHIAVLESLLSDTKTDSTEKIAHKYTLEQVKKNRVGNSSTNFKYTTKKGKKGSLYNLKGKYTLILFYDTGCNVCAETIADLNKSQIINDLIASKGLNILSINSDNERWDDGKIPSKWIDARDDGDAIEAKELYHIPATPSLYLLDAKKNVILKDTYPVNVIQYLTNNLK